MEENKKISKGYKPSPLGPIPEEWDVVPSSVAIKYFGGNAFSSDDSLERGVRWLKIANVGVEKVKWEDESFLPAHYVDEYNKYLLKEGDVVMALTRPILNEKLKIARIEASDTPALLNQRVAKLIQKPGSSLGFLYYVLQQPHFVYSMNAAMAGTDPPNIGNGALEKIKIALAPLKEQTAIANLLNTWDKAINILTQLITQKEQRKKYLMQQLLTGKKRLKGFNGEWKEYHLADFFDERNETNYLNLPLLSIGQTGVYPQGESAKKDNSNEDKSKYRRICPGDIGYNTMRMWQGRSALSKLEGIVSPAYTILKPKKNADPLFFSFLFKTPKLINSFFRNSQGLVEDTLNCKYKDFAIVKTHLPEKDEQVAIAKIILETGKDLSLLNRKAELLKSQKYGLMQILLTGKKRLKYK